MLTAKLAYLANVINKISLDTYLQQELIAKSKKPLMYVVCITLLTNSFFIKIAYVLASALSRLLLKKTWPKKKKYFLALAYK